ncbi:MAG: MFS transporter [Vicinamibacterales bacterium]
MSRPRVPGGWRHVSGTVWVLGLTSFVTDISSEMITSVLPLYLVIYRQMSPLAYGSVDALYQAAAALVRVASGVVADRSQRHKAIAATGYGLSALAKLAYLFGPAWSTLLAAVTLDRIGKGLRTAPRDAMIAAVTPAAHSATAFGVHRALDAAGAAIGPLVTFAVLALVPGGYDQVFLVSFVCAVIGVAALVLLVEPPAPVPSSHVSLRDHAHAVWHAPEFRRIAAGAGLVSVATISDGLIYLVVQQQTTFAPSRLPLLFVGTQAAYFLLAGPLGMLADRTGARTMFLAGHAALVAVYLSLWLGVSSQEGLAVVLLALGAYYAATDGVLTAMASRVLPPESRASGLGLLATGTTTARGLAALLFGALWTMTSTTTAMACFVVTGAIATATAAAILPRDATRAGVVA